MFGVYDGPRAHARGYRSAALCEGWESAPFRCVIARCHVRMYCIGNFPKPPLQAA